MHEIIALSSGIFTKNWGRIVLIQACWFVPGYIISELLIVKLAPSPSIPSFLLQFLGLAVFFVLGFCGTAYSAPVARDALEGLPPGSDRQPRENPGFFKILLISLLGTWMIMAGLLPLLIPSAVISVYLQLLPLIASFENRKPLSSIGRSFVLIKGSFGPVALIWLCELIIGLIVSYGGAVISVLADSGRDVLSALKNGGLLDPALTQKFRHHLMTPAFGIHAATIIAQLITNSFLTVVFTLFYLNRSALKDGTYLIDRIRETAPERIIPRTRAPSPGPEETG